MIAKGTEQLPQQVTLSMPDGWTSASGMHADQNQQRYHANDLEQLVDSPIMAGDLQIRRFDVAGVPHALVYNRGAVPVDDARVVADLKAFTTQTRAFWHADVWEKYVFLIAFRDAGGGLEHAYSTLMNVNPERFATPAGYKAFVSLAAHEYQHAFNVKRLRPAELGPFDFETTPSVSTLWISEGLTSYYSNLMLRRSGLLDDADYLASLSRQISSLQNAPGRLKQSLTQSSLGVWSNSMSGIGVSNDTVSYYTKGEVAGFLLDAHLRELSDGKKSLDDVMRLAYARYSGLQGFQPTQFAAVAAEVAGRSLDGWFGDVVNTPGELDYTSALDWYGLSLQHQPAEKGETWTLSKAADVTTAQQQHLQHWLSAKAP